MGFFDGKWAQRGQSLCDLKRLIIVRQIRRPSCQRNLGSLHMWQSGASHWADCKTFHIILCFYLANIRIKTDNSMRLEPFSLKITDYLALFHIFSALKRWYASTTSRIDMMYILSRLPSRGVRWPSIQLSSWNCMQNSS